MTARRPSTLWDQVVGVQALTRFGESEVAAELYCDEGIDGKTFQRYIDRSVSVSALPETETSMIFDDGVIDEQYRRFLPCSEDD